MTTLKDLQTFTKALGFSDDESVFFRLLKPKNFDPTNKAHCKALPGVVYPKGDTIVTRSTNLRWDQSTGNLHGFADSVVSSDIVSYLTQQNKLGMAVCIVPNPGGQSEKDITEARVIYYENDTDTIADQVAKFNELNQKWGGGFAIQTRRSVHSYFRLDTSVTPDEFTILQKRLISSIDGSDDCIHDPSRVMRVPGFNHIEMVNDKAEYKLIMTIHDWDGTFASLTQIESDLPKIDTTNIISKKSNPIKACCQTNKVNLNNSNPLMKPLISLLKVIAPEHRNLIELGTKEGGRNNDGFKVASDLIGSANYMDSIGQKYIDTPEELLTEFASHCVPPLDDSEVSQIFASAEKSNPSPCLDNFKIANNINSYYETIVIGPKGFDNAIPLKTYSPFKTLLNDELDDLDVDDIRKKFSTPSSSRDCWSTIRKSLPTKVVKIIEYFHGRTGIPKESYVFAYLVQAASILTNKFDVFVSDKWIEPLNLFYVLVADPGFKKTSVLSLFGNFHADLNEQYREEYSQALKVYNKELAQYVTQCKEDSEGDYEEPEKPTQRVSSLGKATFPKLTEVLQSQLKHNRSGLCQQTDEITSILGSMDANGGSAEVSAILSIHSGEELKNSTKCDGIQGVPNARMCIAGTSQPKTWSKVMHQHSDENGLEDRFLISLIRMGDIKPFDHTDVSQAPYDAKQIMFDLVDEFEDIQDKRYIRIDDSIRPMLNDKIEAWAHTNVSKFAKPKAHVYRIAGLLAALRDKDNPLIVAQDIHTAFALSLYSEDCKDELGRDKEATIAEGIVNKAIDLITLKGTLTASQLSSNIYALRSAPLDDRYKVIEKVAEIMGADVIQSLNAKGKLSLTLKSAQIVPTTVYTPIVIETVLEPVIEVKEESEIIIDNTDLDTVEFEGSQNMMNVDTIVIEPEESLEERLTMGYVEQSLDQETIYIPLENLTPEQQTNARIDSTYLITKKIGASRMVIMNDGRSVLIPASQLEKQNATNTEHEDF